PMMKQESLAAKMSWVPPGSNSDILTTVAGYEAWAELYNKREFQAASKFCVDNFLSRPTLILIHKIRAQLLHSLYTAGVIDVSAGGALNKADPDRETVPAALNANAASLPLLYSLISTALQPKFAARIWGKMLRTTRDKVCRSVSCLRSILNVSFFFQVVFLHPNGVNAPAMDEAFDRSCPPELYSFVEKRQNISVGSSGQTFLVGTTRMEPLPYILFGAYDLKLTGKGLECDKWLLFGGEYDTLADIHLLRQRVDACMRRVFEGISKHPRQQPRKIQTRRSWTYVDEDELVSERDYGEDDLISRDHRLSNTEIQELDFLTRDMVRILDEHSVQVRDYCKSHIISVLSMT
ncbi:MAG TPA: hypothetical protein VGO47_10610, partial [Chlamydiales bacterium]|nr:hypothetical protein [Chlamydiales bacterium]